jgi:hypothetical protein
MFYPGMIPRVSCFFWMFVHLSLQFIIHETPCQGSSLVQSMSGIPISFILAILVSLPHPNGDLLMRIFCDKNTLVRVELEMHDAHYTFNVRRRGLPRDSTTQVAA